MNLRAQISYLGCRGGAKMVALRQDEGGDHYLLLAGGTHLCPVFFAG